MADEEELPPPPPEFPEDDEEELDTVDPLPPPSHDEEHEMTEEEAATTGVDSLQKGILKYALREALSNPAADVLKEKLAEDSYTGKIVLALTVISHEWSTQDDEDADMLDFEWTDVLKEKLAEDSYTGKI